MFARHTSYHMSTAQRWYRIAQVAAAGNRQRESPIATESLCVRLDLYLSCWTVATTSSQAIQQPIKSASAEQRWLRVHVFWRCCWWSCSSIFNTHPVILCKASHLYQFYRFTYFFTRQHCLLFLVNLWLVRDSLTPAIRLNLFLLTFNQITSNSSCESKDKK